MKRGVGMNKKGYIYVLTNSSMDGIVKIGKTKRSPETRVQELSQATGVPTPFVLVYSACVFDCDHAENYIHTYFETKGKRLADNREFFNVSTTEAINAIHEYQDEFGIAVDDGDIEDGDVENVEHEFPWLAVERRADEYYYGLGETLQDYRESIVLYKQAMKLGSPTAPMRLGGIYQFGYGVTVDLQTAVDYFKQGVTTGDYSYYGCLATAYFQMNHLENAVKAIEMYINKIEKIDPFFLSRYMEEMYNRNLPINHLEKIMEFKNEILELQDELLKSIDSSDPSLISKSVYRCKVYEYIKYVLEAPKGTELLCGQDYEMKLLQQQQKKAQEDKAHGMIMYGTSLIIVFVFIKIMITSLFFSLVLAFILAIPVSLILVYLIDLYTKNNANKTSTVSK